MESLFKQRVRRLSVRGIFTLPSGKSMELNPEDILSFSISEGVQDGVLLGACPSGTLRLSLADPRGDFLYLGEKRGAAMAAGARVQLFLRIVDFEKAWTETPLGLFYVTDMTGRENDVACTLQGTDALGYLFDHAFMHTLSYPATLLQLAQTIARQADMTVNEDFPGADFTISKRPDFEGFTLRQALSCLCQSCGCFAHVDRQGNLRIVPVRDPQSDTPYEIRAQNTLLRQYGEICFGPMNALRIHLHRAPREAEDGVLLLTDETGISESTLLDIDRNPLFAYGNEQAAVLGELALEQLKGLYLTRAQVRWQGDPRLQLGRCVELRDKRGYVTLTQVTRQTLQFDRGFTMQTDCTVRTPFSLGSGVVLSSGGSISGSSLTGTVDGALIGEGSLGVTALNAHSITGHYIAANAIDAEHLTAGAVTADKIESKTITADKLQAGLITADSGLIAEGAIGTAQIANGSITDAKIVELTANKINAGTLSVERLVVVGDEKSIVYTINEANGTPQLSQTTIDGGSLTERTITADRIVAGSITSDEIAANAVTANQILAGAVTTDKLDAFSVTADKLAAESVTANKMAADVGRTLDLSSNESVRASVVAGVENSAMTLTKDEFTLAFDGKNVMEVDEDSAVFDVDTLTATGQIIGNVVNTQKAGSVTVPAGASIQSAIDNLGKYLLGNVYVYVEGQHTENVKLQGFYGMGTLYLSFRSGAVLSGSIEAVYCKSISIIGPSQTACCLISGADECIKIRNVERCNIYHVYMRGGGRNHGIFCEYCMAFIEECTFAGFVYGMEVKANSQVSVYACMGGGTGENALSTYALYVRGGGMATVYGSTRPVGTMYDGGGSGFLRDCGATETSAAGEAPVLSQTMTVTPDSAYGCVSQTAAGNSTLVHDWGYYANPFQGKYSAAGGYMHGIWIFADGLSALRTAIENAQVESAAVTIKRANAYGTDGKTLRLWYHEKTSKPSGSWPSAIFTDTGLTATVDRGKSVTFALTEELIGKLKSGAIKGFGVSSMRNSDLMQLDGSVCDVTVVYK